MRKVNLIPIAGILMGASALMALPATGHAQSITFEEVNPNAQGDGTMSAGVARRLSHGALTLPADDLLKDEADRASAAAAPAAPAGGAADAAAGGSGPAPNAAIVGGHNFAGQNSVNSAPPDMTGAIGPTRYIQTINSIVRIVNRTTHAAIANGTLNQLAGQASTVNSFDPQLHWDNQTNKFYYSMDSIFSSTDHKLSFGFSKTASPANVTSDWCHYQISYGTPFPDYPKMGDSQFFTIIGVNVFNGNSYVGSDILAIGKPTSANITTCPAASSFKFGIKQNILDSTNTRAFTPTPSQQVDNNPTGYVVARNLSLPSTRIWFFNVTRNSTTGNPVFGNARGVTVASYTVPPSATQPTFTQVLDTLDARHTQAVQAINPDRGSIHSFYTQHTVRNGNFAAVRWYEINPATATPTVLRTGLISSTNAHIFNAAISPDRRRAGTATTATFGDSFVEHHNSSSPSIAPRIVAGSSFNGGAVGGFVVVKNGVGGYRDFTCPNSGNRCRWGDYAAATPDPAPTNSGRGMVWGTNMFSGVTSPSAGAANGRTQIFALQP